MNSIFGKQKSKQGNRSSKTNTTRQPRRPRARQDLVERSVLRSNVGSNLIKFDRTTLVTSYAMVPNTGFQPTAAAAGYDIQMSFSLAQTLLYINGTLDRTVTNPGNTEVVNMFQEYKIDSVEVMLAYSNNCSQINNVSNLPILQIAYDQSGVADVNSAAILQFENLKVIQLGNYRGDAGPVLTLKPKPIFNTNNSQLAYIAPENSWISTLASSVPHYSLKIVYDPMATTSATSVGNLEFYVRYHISARKTN